MFRNINMLCCDFDRLIYAISKKTCTTEQGIYEYAGFKPRSVHKELLRC